MRIDWVQEGTSRQAIRPPGEICSRRVVRASVAANRVAAGVPQIRIVDSKLGVVEDIERFRAKLNLATLLDHKMLEQGHVEIEAAGIIEEISSRVPER